MCLNLCYLVPWTPKWRKIFPSESADPARAAASADFVAAELPEHLLLVVIRLNAPAEPVETEWIGCHGLGTGTAKCSTLLPGNAHRQADESMAIDERLVIMPGAVVQDGNTVEILAPLGNGRIVHAEEDRLLPQCLGNHGKHVLRQGLADGCIRDEPVAESAVVAVQ